VSLPADLITRPVRHVSVPPQRYRATQSAVVDSDAIELTARLLAEAERPCFLVGHGVACARAYDELLHLAHALGAPVATSPKGKGAFPENDPLSLGVFGFGGHDRAESYLQSGDVDVLVVIGSSLNEFVTNAWTAEPRPRTAFVQIDLDPTSIAKNYPVDVAVVGDARAALRELIHRFPKYRNGLVGAMGTHRGPAHPLPSPFAFEVPENGHAKPLKPQRLVLELRRAMSNDTMLFVDNGNSILWATHYFEVRKPGTYFIDLGLSAMGSAVAGVVGAALAAPGRPVVALVGDAAFAMHGFEVHTAVEECLPVVWVVLNNGGHGMVHQGDTLMKGRDLGVSLFRSRLDVASIAKGVGARGVRVKNVPEFRVAIRDALQAQGPTVIDAAIDTTEIAPTLERRVESLARFFSSGAGGGRNGLGGE
jgi:acetolactate synthase-1/2/3 large subunit